MVHSGSVVAAGISQVGLLSVSSSLSFVAVIARSAVDVPAAAVCLCCFPQRAQDFSRICKCVNLKPSPLLLPQQSPFPHLPHYLSLSPSPPSLLPVVFTSTKTTTATFIATIPMAITLRASPTSSGSTRPSPSSRTFATTARSGTSSPAGPPPASRPPSEPPSVRQMRALFCCQR